ncbi:spore coat associated protein CotJA [Paramaledivibacter caminithermalis]|jgi:hypothetical protein|uniref:Spore coat associated protein JA (CotJA) n=1 Tax=Paramaledivibacter caminithermalis (strain DSM 15212 / CIP 107654 / DViRD3) TaxID=1121301 RepID=A0A1M6T1D0_PARC5|nr:spore coat associated protein CotJA [Paramaledivibacter caminithermalis]SHK50737.1 Spore coat associated protein JA (CotJA) [Paramaledivibacter caminithermalis DSM 15212]
MNKNYENKCTLVGKCQLARLYIINQPFGEIYSPQEALIRGTIFPDLYEPYVRTGKKGEEECKK